MKKIVFILFAVLFSVNIYAQNGTAVVENNNASLELAKNTVQAHGGDKLLQMKNLFIAGTADLTSSASSQAIPASFAMVFAGDKYRLDIQSPFFNFKQVFDGENSYSSIGNFGIPLDKSGLQLLVKYNNPGYKVTALTDKKKKNGFRITSPDGFYTDYVINEKTNQVKEFVTSYQIGSGTLTTSVDVEKYREVDGMWINEKFSQRLQTPQGEFYASYKAKDILVNREMTADVFAIPK